MGAHRILYRSLDKLVGRFKFIIKRKRFHNFKIAYSTSYGDVKTGCIHKRDNSHNISVAFLVAF